MAKKKEEKVKEEVFNIEEAFEGVNEYLRDGFKKFIYQVKKVDVKTQKEFNKLLREYGGD